MRAWILDESPGGYRWGVIDDPVVGPGRRAVRPVASALNHMDLWLTQGHAAAPAAARAGLRRRRRRRRGGAGCRPTWRPATRSSSTRRLRRSRRSSRTASTRPLAAGFADPGRAPLGRPRRAARRPGPQRRAPPAGRSWEECAAYPLATLTAWRMLRRAALTPARRCWSSGIGGGVCTAALAPGAAAWAPWSTSRPATTAKRTRALELGAADAFDSEADWPVRSTSWSRASARRPGTAR